MNKLTAKDLNAENHFWSLCGTIIVACVTAIVVVLVGG